jgi:hypothetical protein
MEESELMPDQSPREEIMYPEVDELVQYPSAQSQLAVGQVFTAPILDPRLHNQLVSLGIDAPDGIQHDDIDAYSVSSSKGFFDEDLDIGESSEDPSFVASEESSSR